MANRVYYVDTIYRDKKTNQFLYLINKNIKLSKSSKEDFINQFWDMYMLDAILANRDRHGGNWGYLVKDKVAILAPIYDNGACLFSDVLPKLEEYTIDRKQFLYDRSERFPASLFMVYSENGGRNKRTNYYEIVGQYNAYKEMRDSYYKLRDLGIFTIYSTIRIICDNEYIDSILGDFIVDIVCIRYMHIILRLDFEESYRRLLEICQR